MNSVKVPLGSVAKVLNGYAFKSKEYVDGGIRVIRITNVQKGHVRDDSPKFIDENRRDEFSRFMLGSGDILISLTGNVGRVGELHQSMLPAALNQRVGALRITDQDTDSRYLFHVLNSYGFEQDAIKNSKGIAQLNLSSKWVERYEIPLPLLPEQKRIVGILDAADALRAKRRASLAQLDTLLQSIFLDMFGNPVTNPMGWERANLESFCRPRQWPTIKKSELLESGYPVFGANGRIGFYSDFNHAEATVLITCRGATCGTINVCYPNSYVTGNAMALNDLDRTRVSLRFLEHALAATDFTPAITGVAQPQITRQSLRRILVHIPPLPLQHRFVTLVESIEQQKTDHRAHLAELDTLFASLQSRAFRGEL